ncbi:transketolase family protein [Dongia sp.]|uniref:transketolase family protein n=1 Tax=Dongia sp. TaxID=1977262 RepID=UPI0035B374BF
MRQTAINAVYALAQRDSRVTFIGSDLSPGLLDAMKQSYPDRFYMEGVSEAHVIGMAAGMAMEGYMPFVNTIATFLTRRCFDQVAIDVCLENLPVRLLANGGGVVYAPLGPTHLATEDIAILRALPNMTIVAPVDAMEMGRLMDATLSWPGPIYIRIAKGGDPIVSRPDLPFAIGKAIEMREPGDITLIATGIMTNRALTLADALKAEGVRCGVLHMHTVKPLDDAAVLEAARQGKLLVSMEEHSIIGGLGTAIAELLSDHGATTRLLRLALPDRFPVGYGSQDHLLSEAGLSVPEMLARIRASLAALG